MNKADELCPRCQVGKMPLVLIGGNYHKYKCNHCYNFSRCDYTNGKVEYNLMFPNYKLLRWHQGTQRTQYFPAGGVVYAGPLSLPWLPFTITEEKLKLYILFS